jgi:alkyl hydroperoxide reductase subunit AhpF
MQFDDLDQHFESSEIFVGSKAWNQDHEVLIAGTKTAGAIVSINSARKRCRAGVTFDNSARLAMDCFKR